MASKVIEHNLKLLFYPKNSVNVNQHKKNKKILKKVDIFLVN